MKRGFVLLLINIVALVGQPASASSEGCYARCVTQAQKAQARHAINFVFGGHAAAALRVARCESGLSVNAFNGQYKGLFQMGRGERARYGHGPTPWEQAIAAYRYYRASGSDWSPWSCKP